MKKTTKKSNMKKKAQKMQKKTQKKIRKIKPQVQKKEIKEEVTLEKKEVAEKPVFSVNLEKHEKNVHVKHNEFLFWVMLFLSWVGNLVILIGIFPLIIKFPSLYLVFIGILAFLFGLVIHYLLKEHSFKGHHYITGAFLLYVINFINVMAIYEAYNYYKYLLDLKTPINPLLIAITYFVCFTLPHFMHKIRNL